MKTVWKFHVHIARRTTVVMPLGATVIRVGIQNAFGQGPAMKVMLWAIVDPQVDVEHRDFQVVGTGHPIPDGSNYVGSTEDMAGELQWHVFEIVKR